METFYTIQPGDVGRAIIHTPRGPLPMACIMGPAQKGDVGKRIYYAASLANSQAENNEQRDARCAVHARFKDLAIGDRFRFASEGDPKFRFSGMARGPWIKVSSRRYDHVDADGLKGVRVGTPNVDVLKEGAAS